MTKLAAHLLVLTLIALRSASAQTLDVITLSNEPVPGAAPGVTFGVLLTGPSINAAGEVSVHAVLGGNESGNRSIWSEGASVDRLVAKQNGGAPGGIGLMFDLSFSVPAFNGPGDNAFSATLRQGIGGVTANDNSGIWAENATVLDLVAREGSLTPSGPAGAVFDTLGPPQLSDFGDVAFFGSMQIGPGGVTSSDNRGLWLGLPPAIDLVARVNDPLPGSASAIDSTGDFVLTSAGDLFFGAVLAGLPTQTGIWSVPSGGSPSLVVISGTVAPDTGGAEFDTIIFATAVNLLAANNSFGANAAGQVAFPASLVLDPPVVLGNSSGIWSGSAGALRLVARRGEPAPGTAAVFHNLANSLPVIDDAGHVAFRAGLGTTVPAPSGIWSERTGPLASVALEGAAAPGAPAGALFDTLTDHPIVNPEGRVAFRAMLEIGPGGVSAADAQGLWAEDASGALVLVLRQGDVIPLSSTDSGTILQIRPLTAAPTTGPTTVAPFNLSGDLVFAVDLADGRDAVLVARLPEPGPALQLVASLGVLGAIKRRRRP